MGALTWLKVSRRVPGLNKEPEFQNLEALVESEAARPSDAYHIARWVVPLVASVIGISTFLPLALFVHPGFFYGMWGMVGLGGILGFIFHRVALTISESRLALRRRVKVLAGRMLRLRSLLGLDPALSPAVGKLLDEAAVYYFKVCGEAPGAGRRHSNLMTQSRARSEAAMEAAMAKMLELAEPDNSAAQEIRLNQGWALPLLKEMRSLSEAVQRQDQEEGIAEAEGTARDTLAALRTARGDIESIEEALQELQSEQSR